jgi:hypothetical protein
VCVLWQCVCVCEKLRGRGTACLTRPHIKLFAQFPLQYAAPAAAPKYLPIYTKTARLPTGHREGQPVYFLPPPLNCGPPPSSPSFLKLESGATEMVSPPFCSFMQ